MPQPTHRWFTKLLSLSLLLALGLPAARASVPIGDGKVQIGGFFSQGYLESSGNNYPVKAKGGTFNLREMAVNASTTVGDHLRLGAQGFAQRLGDYGQDKVILDWAVADYNFREELGIRVGRVKFAKGLYGEALDVDAIRPFIFLPMGVYNPSLRDWASSFDGGMVYGSLNAGKTGSFDYKVFYGDIKMKPDQIAADFFNSVGIFAPSGLTEMGIDHVRGAQLFWNTPVSGLKVGYSYYGLAKLTAKGPFAYFPAVQASISMKGALETHIGSVEYIRGDWTFAAEYSQMKGTGVIATPFMSVTSPSSSTYWYVSAARKFAQKFEAGTYYSAQSTNDPTGLLPDKAKHLNDWTIALKYEVNEHLLFKIENHWIDGYQNVINTARTPNPSPKGTSTLFAAKMTLSF